MNRADHLFDEYWSMTDAERKHFDRRVREHRAFKASLEGLADKVSKMTDAEAKAFLAKLKSKRGQQ